MSAESKTPHRRLMIQDRDNWEAEARAFAALLAEQGERPWFEVFYPAPEHLDEEEQTWWLERQANLDGVGTFDAVELVDGQFVTLPPYTELRGEQS